MHTSMLDLAIDYAACMVSCYMREHTDKWTVVPPLRENVTREMVSAARTAFEQQMALARKTVQKSKRVAGLQEEKTTGTRLKNVLDLGGAQIENSAVDTQEARFAHIETLCGGNTLAMHTVILCLFLHISPRVMMSFEEQNIQDITLELVANLLYDLFPEEGDVRYQSMAEAFKVLETVLLVEHENHPMYRVPFYADERLYAYLCGDDAPDRRIAPFVEVFVPKQDAPSQPQPLFVAEELCAQLARELKWSAVNVRPRVQLSGEEGAGKRLLVRHACDQNGQKMLFIDVQAFDFEKEKTTAGRALILRRELLFYGMGACFWNIGAEGGAVRTETLPQFLQQCFALFAPLAVPMVLCTAPQMKLVPQMKDYVAHIALAPLTRMERVAVWRGYTKQYRLARVDCTDVGTRFQFTPAEIEKACQRLAHMVACGEHITTPLLSQVCTQVLPPPSQGNIKKIDVSYTLDDLKLDEVQKAALLNICAHVSQRHTVYDTWGMEEKYAYGKNVSALLVGPPGTGKTMAVHVLSNLLNLPLYKIDLSQVVDKYIGETEKRLEEIFTTAEKNNVILFFDEADSVFGKRSEVNDAKDKYANTEVSYILQRIEQYDGIVLLATNYKKNIDEAFMRRIRYLIEFQLPNKTLREEIWRSSFSDRVPMEHIDFAFLAKQFELSGGSIKNIVLNATFLAAQSKSAVTMAHILHCVRIENHKMNKTMIAQDFAEYAYLMQNDRYATE